MRYKVEFEFDSEQKNPQNWYWTDILANVEDENTSIDPTTISVFRNAGWEKI
jgi:hypothetical protein